MSKEVLHQSLEFATLGSCAKYFEKIRSSENEISKMIKFQLSNLNIRPGRQQFPPNVNLRKRNHVSSDAMDRKQNEPGVKKSALNAEVSTTSNETPQSEFQFDPSNYTFESERQDAKVEPKNEIKSESSQEC